MNRDDINRWEAEINSWRQRYEALLKTLADSKYLTPPMMLADKQSYELGLFHGAAAERDKYEAKFKQLEAIMQEREQQPNKPCCLAERESCAKVCELMEQQAEGTECCKWPTPADCAAAIRERSNP